MPRGRPRRTTRRTKADKDKQEGFSPPASANNSEDEAATAQEEEQEEEKAPSSKAPRRSKRARKPTTKARKSPLASKQKKDEGEKQAQADKASDDVFTFAASDKEDEDSGTDPDDDNSQSGDDDDSDSDDSRPIIKLAKGIKKKVKPTRRAPSRRRPRTPVPSGAEESESENKTVVTKKKPVTRKRGRAKGSEDESTTSRPTTKKKVRTRKSSGDDAELRRDGESALPGGETNSSENDKVRENLAKTGNGQEKSGKSKDNVEPPPKRRKSLDPPSNDGNERNNEREGGNSADEANIAASQQTSQRIVKPDPASSQEDGSTQASRREGKPDPDATKDEDPTESPETKAKPDPDALHGDTDADQLDANSTEGDTLTEDTDVQQTASTEKQTEVDKKLATIKEDREESDGDDDKEKGKYDAVYASEPEDGVLEDKKQGMDPEGQEQATQGTTKKGDPPGGSDPPAPKESQEWDHGQKEHVDEDEDDGVAIAPEIEHETEEESGTAADAEDASINVDSSSLKAGTEGNKIDTKENDAAEAVSNQAENRNPTEEEESESDAKITEHNRGAKTAEQNEGDLQVGDAASGDRTLNPNKEDCTTAIAQELERPTGIKSIPTEHQASTADVEGDEDGAKSAPQDPPSFGDVEAIDVALIPDSKRKSAESNVSVVEAPQAQTDVSEVRDDKDATSAAYVEDHTMQKAETTVKGHVSAGADDKPVAPANASAVLGAQQEAMNMVAREKPSLDEDPRQVQHLDTRNGTELDTKIERRSSVVDNSPAVAKENNTSSSGPPATVVPQNEDTGDATLSPEVLPLELAASLGVKDKPDTSQQQQHDDDAKEGKDAVKPAKKGEWPPEKEKNGSDLQDYDSFHTPHEQPENSSEKASPLPLASHKEDKDPPPEVVVVVTVPNKDNELTSIEQPVLESHHETPVAGIAEANEQKSMEFLGEPEIPGNTVEAEGSNVLAEAMGAKSITLEGDSPSKGKDIQIRDDPARAACAEPTLEVDTALKGKDKGEVTTVKDLSVTPTVEVASTPMQDKDTGAPSKTGTAEAIGSPAEQQMKHDVGPSPKEAKDAKPDLHESKVDEHGKSKALNPEPLPATLASSKAGAAVIEDAAQPIEEQVIDNLYSPMGDDVAESKVDEATKPNGQIADPVTMSKEGAAPKAFSTEGAVSTVTKAKGVTEDAAKFKKPIEVDSTADSKEGATSSTPQANKTTENVSQNKDAMESDSEGVTFHVFEAKDSNNDGSTNKQVAEVGYKLDSKEETCPATNTKDAAKDGPKFDSEEDNNFPAPKSRHTTRDAPYLDIERDTSAATAAAGGTEDGSKPAPQGNTSHIPKAETVTEDNFKAESASPKAMDMTEDGCKPDPKIDISSSPKAEGITADGAKPVSKEDTSTACKAGDATVDASKPDSKGDSSTEGGARKAGDATVDASKPDSKGDSSTEGGDPKGKAAHSSRAEDTTEDGSRSDSKIKIISPARRAEDPVEDGPKPTFTEGVTSPATKAKGTNEEVPQNEGTMRAQPKAKETALITPSAANTMLPPSAAETPQESFKAVATEAAEITVVQSAAQPKIKDTSPSTGCIGGNPSWTSEKQPSTTCDTNKASKGEEVAEALKGPEGEEVSAMSRGREGAPEEDAALEGKPVKGANNEKDIEAENPKSEDKSSMPKSQDAVQCKQGKSARPADTIAADPLRTLAQTGDVNTRSEATHAEEVLLAATQTSTGKIKDNSSEMETTLTEGRFAESKQEDAAGIVGSAQLQVKERSKAIIGDGEKDFLLPQKEGEDQFKASVQIGPAKDTVSQQKELKVNPKGKRQTCIEKCEAINKSFLQNNHNAGTGKGKNVPMERDDTTDSLDVKGERELQGEKPAYNQCKEACQEDEEVKVKTKHREPRRCDIGQIKMLLFSASSSVHRGRGFEKMFSEYWGALSLIVAGQESNGKLLQLRCFVRSFLKTKRLRILHNRLIMALIDRSLQDRVAASEVSGFVSESCRSRVKVITRSNKPLIELQTVEGKHIATSGKRPPIAKGTPQPPASGDMFTPGAEALEKAVDYGKKEKLANDKSCAVLLADGEAIPYAPLFCEKKIENKDGDSATGVSSNLPGALAVDPLVRYIVQSEGMKVSEHAVWLFVVALKEHTKSVVSRAIQSKEARRQNRIPQQLYSTPVLCRGNKSPSDSKKESVTSKKKGKRKADLKLANDKTISVSDLALLSASMQISPANSIRGTISRLACERCIFALAKPSPAIGGSAFQQVHNFLTSGIEAAPVFWQIAPKQPPSKNTSSTAKQALTATPESGGNQNQVDNSMKGDEFTVLKLTSNPNSVPEGRNVRSPVQAMGRGGKNLGLGRGAKNLAALMARSTTSKPPTSAPGVDACGASNPSKQAPAPLSPPAHVAPSAAVPMPPTVTQTLAAPPVQIKSPAALEESQTQTQTEGSNSAAASQQATSPQKGNPNQVVRRGRGLGKKNLAFMRARVVTDAPSPVPPFGQAAADPQVAPGGILSADGTAAAPAAQPGTVGANTAASNGKPSQPGVAEKLMDQAGSPKNVRQTHPQRQPTKPADAGNEMQM